VRIKHRRSTFFIDYAPKDTVLHLKYRLLRSLPQNAQFEHSPKDVKAIRLVIAAKGEVTAVTGAPAGTPLATTLTPLDDGAVVEKTIAADKIILATFAIDEACRLCLQGWAVDDFQAQSLKMSTSRLPINSTTKRMRPNKERRE
jgi:hypothetical protein